MRQFFSVALLLVIAVPGAGVEPVGTNSDPFEAAKAVMQSIREPRFAASDFPAADYRQNDWVIDRAAILAAINACHRAGGGRVVIPPGDHSIQGPIHLKSNVNLHLSRGCRLEFSTQYADYLPRVLTRFEGTELFGYSPLIYALDAENVALTGDGIIDGAASESNWWAWKGSEKEDIKKLRQFAEDDVPLEDRILADAFQVRPNFVQFYRCKNVLIEGVTLIRSPMWNIHPVLCENVTVRRVTVDSHGPNNDGCNPESCSNVLIEDCKFDTGDDCIAIKSGRNSDGRRIGKPSENIIVRRCEMKDGHGGVVLGSEMSGGIRNIFVEDCKMDSPNLERAIRLKSNSLRGGYLENMCVRNIEVGEVSDAVLRINLEYWGETGEHFPVVRNIFLRNVTSKKSRRPLYLVGLRQSAIENVVVEDCQFNGAQEPSIIRHVQSLQLLDYSQAE